MERKDLLRIGMYVGLAFLLIIIIVTIFHFTSNKDNVVIDLTQTETEEVPPFLNLTDQSETYIRELVKTKKEELQKVFENMTMYKLNDEEDETSELAVGQLFIDDLTPLVSTELMDEIMEHLTPVNPNEIIDSLFDVYTIDEDWLKEIKEHSAIAFDNVSEYKLYLLEATDTEIKSTITIIKCGKVCDIKEDYKFNLLLDEETNTWKVDLIK